MENVKKQEGVFEILATMRTRPHILDLALHPSCSHWTEKPNPINLKPWVQI